MLRSDSERRIRQLILPAESAASASRLESKGGKDGEDGPAAETDPRPSSAPQQVLRRPAYLAKALENRLYHTAASYRTYLDPSTLERRLRTLCSVLGGRIERLQRERRERGAADDGTSHQDIEGVGQRDTAKGGEGGGTRPPKNRREAAAALEAALGSEMYRAAAGAVLSARALRSRHANDRSMLGIAGKIGERAGEEEQGESADGDEQSNDEEGRDDRSEPADEDKGSDDAAAQDYRKSPAPDPEVVSPARIALRSPAAELYFDPDLSCLMKHWDRRHQGLVTTGDFDESVTGWRRRINRAQAIVSDFRRCTSEGGDENSGDYRN